MAMEKELGPILVQEREKSGKTSVREIRQIIDLIGGGMGD